MTKYLRDISLDSEGEKEKKAEKESCKVKKLCQVSASLLVASAMVKVMRVAHTEEYRPALKHV